MLYEEGTYQDNYLISANSAPRQPSTSTPVIAANLSGYKESAVDANIAAKKAVISGIIQNAGRMQTNKQRVQPAREMLRLQKDLVQYLKDAVNSNELTPNAKLKYQRFIATENETVYQYEDLLKITQEAADRGL